MKALIGLIAFHLAVSIAAFPHNLDVECFGEAGELTTKAWTGDDPAVGADIEILSQTGEILASGELDENGTFRWKPKQAHPITVYVYVEAGHEKEIEISADAMRDIIYGAGQHESGAKTQPARKVEVYSSERQHQKAARLMLGITFIIALAALSMAWRNQKALKRLETKLRD